MDMNMQHISFAKFGLWMIANFKDDLVIIVIFPILVENSAFIQKNVAVTCSMRFFREF